MHVGSDYSSKRQFYQVVAYKLSCRYRLPGAVALDGGIERETRLERLPGLPGHDLPGGKQAQH